MADVKLPNISATNLSTTNAALAEQQQIYNDNPAGKTDTRSHSFHSGRGAGGAFG